VSSEREEPMAYRVEIERALDEMIAEEAGMKFQTLAVVLAKQKWGQLIACERKWDNGLDAYASGELHPDGKGIGLACSLTGTLEKIVGDAETAKKHFSDLGIFIFATAGKITIHKAEQWAEEVRGRFGLELIVISREDLVTTLLDPGNADILRAQFGIPVPVTPGIAGIDAPAHEAAQEVADDWDRLSRRSGRPLIELDAEKSEPNEAHGATVTLANLERLLAGGWRIILEAPAGRGKSTTLVQLSKRLLSSGALALLVDLPAWVRSGKSILQYAADLVPFARRQLDAAALAKLRGTIPIAFLLNGWNEISAATSESAVVALQELERNFPSAGIIVATRTHHLTPPLPGAVRIKLRSLSRKQRDLYLELALETRANELRVKLNNHRMLDEITRTPLILAEVVDLFRSGRDIPATKMGVLGAVMQVLEDSKDHQPFLQQPPLASQAGEYLRALALAMTEKAEIEIGDAEARAEVNSVSAMLKQASQILTEPEPRDVLNELVKHHILERFEQGRVTFRFEHQQFQELFAAGGLGARLQDLLRGQDASEDRLFQKRYSNEPRWGESLRMLGEEIGGRGTEAKEAGVKLVRLALAVDPIFAAELARWCGPGVWSEVREEVGKRLRAWYAEEDRNHKQCALAAMLACGYEDFADILVPLLTNGNQQVRLAVYHGGVEFLPSSLGPRWKEVIRMWPEEARLDFVQQLADDPWLADTVEEIALEDPSAKVKWNVARMLSWYGFAEKVERLLKPLDEPSFREAVRSMHADEMPALLTPRVLNAHETMLRDATDPFERIRILRLEQGLGAKETLSRIKAELEGMDREQLEKGNQGATQGALEELRKTDPKWVSDWLSRKVLEGITRFGGWTDMVTSVSDEQREALFARYGKEALGPNEEPRVRSLLAKPAHDGLAKRAFERCCEIRRGLTSPPGHDQAGWNLFRQVQDLVEAIDPAVLLAGLSEKLENDPELTELGVLVESLARFNPTRDLRSPLSDEVRRKLRVYLKKAADQAASPAAVNGSVRAHLAVLLGQIGEPEDLADIRRLIAADLLRFREMQAARMRGDRRVLVAGDAMSYVNFYTAAVATVDPKRADDVLLELLPEPEYERWVAELLVGRAGKGAGPPTLENNRMDFAKIWPARGGKAPGEFIEDRRIRYANALRAVAERLLKEREAAADKRMIEHRIKFVGSALAALDGACSARLVLEVMKLPGRFDGYSRVASLESLMVWGVRLTLAEAEEVLGPTIAELRARGVHGDNQNAWLLQRCLALLPFVDPAVEGIAKAREILPEMRWRLYELGGVVGALGASRTEEAIDVLLELAGADGSGVEAIGEIWIRAVAALGGKRSNAILLSFVDPNAQVFTREFLPDHRHGDLLAQLLAEKAEAEPDVKTELFRLADGDLSRVKRMVLAKTIARFSKEENLVAGLCVLRDDGSGVPYEVLKSIEDVFLERRPYGTASNIFTVGPRGANAVRKRLFDMARTDAGRNKSAFALLGQIEVWRLEYGRPIEEPRHPAVDSGVPWPPLPS
jgi:hypothetical protein